MFAYKTEGMLSGVWLMFEFESTWHSVKVQEWARGGWRVHTIRNIHFCSRSLKQMWNHSKSLLFSENYQMYLKRLQIYPWNDWIKTLVDYYSCSFPSPGWKQISIEKKYSHLGLQCTLGLWCTLTIGNT